MGALAFKTARKAQYLVLELALPGRPRANAGVLLLDPASDYLHIKLRQQWQQLAEPGDAEVFQHLEQDLRRQSLEQGGEQLLRTLEDTLSNTLRITARETIAVSDFDKALERLYQKHVEGEPRATVSVLRFQTHLPLYPLRAAATKFGEDMEVEAADWVRVPESLRLSADMFVARVVGRSMEPAIPDGSLCVFRYNVVGSRQGKLLLIQHLGASDTGGEFTVKRYTSLKAASGEGWRHERIRLEPLNPEFEAWDLDASELEDGPYRVRGEFLRVLAYEEQ
jgi:phage repressor protein C with HTH and peptisase S24 domain